jgi:hypothetical protein
VADEDHTTRLYLTLEDRTVQGLRAILAEMSPDGAHAMRQIKSLPDVIRYVLDKAVVDWRRGQPAYQSLIAAQRQKLRQLAEKIAAAKTDAEVDSCLKKFKTELENYER